MMGGFYVFFFSHNYYYFLVQLVHTIPIMNVRMYVYGFIYTFGPDFFFILQTYLSYSDQTVKMS